MRVRRKGISDGQGKVNNTASGDQQKLTTVLHKEKKDRLDDFYLSLCVFLLSDFPSFLSASKSGVSISTPSHGNL